MVYYLNIGTNLGNRLLNITRALREIERIFGWFETSETIESRPWGYVSDNIFCNIGVKVVSGLMPPEVLRAVKKAETRLNGGLPHRKPDGTYADRIVDIDIMAAEDVVIDSTDLTLPHRHLPERRFFLQPMGQLAPAWKHPSTGLTCAEMLAKLPPEG